jgi:hypothetical protein
MPGTRATLGEPISHAFKVIAKGEVLTVVSVEDPFSGDQAEDTYVVEYEGALISVQRRQLREA